MEIQKAYLTPNPYSRPRTKMGEIKGLVIHWVGNAKSTALANRNYFEELKYGQTNGKGEKIYASAHYIVGLSGEIIACIPEEEVAYHGGVANGQYLGIEVCHPDSTGIFTPITYEALITLGGALCQKYQLAPFTQVLRHYDLTGKLCPLYYVKDALAWEILKQDIQKNLADYTVRSIEMLLNGQPKQVRSIKREGHHYIKLRDLADQQVLVGYDTKSQRPTLEVRSV